MYTSVESRYNHHNKRTDVSFYHRFIIRALTPISAFETNGYPRFSLAILRTIAMNKPLLLITMDKSRGEHNVRRTINRFLGIIVISLLVVTAFSGPVVGHTGDDGLHHHDGWMDTHGGMGGWMFGGLGYLWMILWTVVIIGIPVALVYLLVTRWKSTNETADDDALALLRKRYAQGEMDDEEFETRRTKLLAEQR